MRLADYVVSYSLQINNRCLRYLAECDVRGGVSAPLDNGDGFAAESHTVFAESLLARDSRRLASMWALMKPGWKDASPELAAHVAALEAAAAQLAEGASGRRLALRLASLANEDYEAEAVLKVARSLPTEVNLTWDALNDLFAEDSRYWRNSVGFKHLEDRVIEHRVTRSYRKSLRLAALIPAADVDLWLDKHAQSLHRWVRLCAHQLELLRPGLSDKGKAQLWYLDKMSDTLRTRSGLIDLRRQTRATKVKKSAGKLAVGHLDQQIEKMNKRIVRLADNAFDTKLKRFTGLVEEAVTSLGLKDVSLMKNPAAGGAAEKDATENAYG